MAEQKRAGRRPSTFVGLADIQARLTADVQRLQSSLTEAQQALDDCNRTMLRLYPNGDPGPAIRSWHHFRNRRGSLRRTLQAILRERAPEALTTRQIAVEMEERLGLRFHSLADRKMWKANSLTSALSKQAAEGFVERTQQGSWGGRTMSSSWRWKAPTRTLETLAAEMEAAGLTHEYVQAAPDDDLP